MSLSIVEAELVTEEKKIMECYMPFRYTVLLQNGITWCIDNV